MKEYGLFIGGRYEGNYYAPTVLADVTPVVSIFRTGGVKNSGFGRVGGKFAMEEFTELKWVTIQLEGNSIPSSHDGVGFIDFDLSGFNISARVV